MSIFFLIFALCISFVLYFYLFLFLFSVVLSRNNSTYAAYSGNITIFNCFVREYIYSRMYFSSFYPFYRGGGGNVKETETFTWPQFLLGCFSIEGSQIMTTFNE